MIQNLPPEVILNIINLVIPPNSRALFPASHVVTRTLLALTTVCRATSAFASELVRQHCVYIDSSIRLREFVATLSYAHLSPPTRIYLSPFRQLAEGQHHPEPELNGVDFSNGLDSDFDDSDIDSFSSAWNPSLMDDPPTARAVRDLLVAVAPTLRSLVVDMPLRSLDPEDDSRNIRPLLREGFSALVNLEEFISIQDELYLHVHDISEPHIWATCWPKLRFLALYDLNLCDTFQALNNWELLARVPRLETVVLPFPAGLFESNLKHGIDVKKRWLDALRAIAKDDEPEPLKDITIGFVGLDTELPEFTKHYLSWRERDPERRIRVRVCEAPFPNRQDVDYPCDFLPSQIFVRKHAWDGTLFHRSLFQDVEDVA